VGGGRIYKTNYDDLSTKENTSVLLNKALIGKERKRQWCLTINNNSNNNTAQTISGVVRFIL